MKAAGECSKCHCMIWLPDSLWDSAVRSHMIPFYCSYGHRQHFTEESIKKYNEEMAKRATEALKGRFVQQQIEAQKPQEPLGENIIQFKRRP